MRASVNLFLKQNLPFFLFLVLKKGCICCGCQVFFGDKLFQNIKGTDCIVCKDATVNKGILYINSLFEVKLVPFLGLSFNNLNDNLWVCDLVD